MPDRSIKRRDFLNLCSLSLGALAFRPWGRILSAIEDFPQSDRLGRVGWYKVDLKEKPDHNSKTVGVLYDDSVTPWLNETIGERPGRNNQRYVETPGGYVWSGDLIPVMNLPNQPLTTLPSGGETPGMWVEVTVPFSEAVLANPPARSTFYQYRIEHGLPLRFYYGQILWVDEIKPDEGGNIWYRVNERYGSPGDILYTRAEALRPLTEEELTPINPTIEDKHIEIKVRWEEQMLSCFEGTNEVYFCRISSGVTQGSTPITAYASKGFPIWRKLYSLHMSGGTNTEGWDLPGIGWTNLFHGEGVAIHSTYWHNNFGEPMSHGCVNVAPNDAKWIFRWTQPEVSFETGDNDVTVTGDPSTRIIVKDE